MRLDQLSGVIAFLKVAEMRSFTRAAAELGVTPSSLSEAVKGLEDRLGVRLLNRTTRSVGLTEAGSAYMARVRPAADEIRAAGTALKEDGRRPVGTLRLSVPWIAGPLLITPLMKPFLSSYPDVRLDVVFEDRFADLAAEGFDAGLRIGELLEKDMVAVRLGGPLRTAVLASPSYLDRHGVPTRVADLSGQHCIAYRFASTGAIAAWEFVEHGREIEFMPEPHLSTNTLTLAVEAAEQGLGLAYAFEGLATAALREGRLVKVLEEQCPSYEPWHIYYPSRHLVPRKLKAFVDLAKAYANASQS